MTADETIAEWQAIGQAISVTAQQALDALAEFAPAFTEAWHGFMYPLQYDRWIGYQHARLMAACLWPSAPPEDTDIVLASLTFD